jgi:hypothetical protein
VANIQPAPSADTLKPKKIRKTADLARWNTDHKKVLQTGALMRVRAMRPLLCDAY